MAIVKILSRHSPTYASLVKYVLRYIVNVDKNDLQHVYTSNLRSDTIAGYVQEFIENEAFRRHTRADQIHLLHEIVSFSSEEVRESITPEMIDDLAHEYMRLRGSTGVILGAPHFDRDHVHLHFCVSALQYRTGLSFGLNKAQLQELKVSFQEYHQRHFPELTRSAPEHGKGGRYASNKRWHKERREGITAAVRQCMTQATSLQHFLELLRENDLHHYERNGEATGIEHDGAKFRFSRLLEPGQLESLPNDRSEEEKALAEIRSVRARQHEREGLSMDFDGRER